jgi:hypothetical protein
MITVIEKELKRHENCFPHTKIVTRKEEGRNQEVKERKVVVLERDR